MKRSGKFYRKNEAEVMKTLGLKPTKNSGSGWVEKEDGQSDEIICQLKSTDASSIRIHKQDIDILEYNAAVSHKLPVFAIQYLETGDVYLLVKPEQLCDVAKYIETGEYESRELFVGVDLGVDKDDTTVCVPTRVIKSSSKGREKFNKEHEKKFEKRGKSAR